LDRTPCLTGLAPRRELSATCIDRGSCCRDSAPATARLQRLRGGPRRTAIPQGIVLFGLFVLICGTNRTLCSSLRDLPRCLASAARQPRPTHRLGAIAPDHQFQGGIIERVAVHLKLLPAHVDSPSIASPLTVPTYFILDLPLCVMHVPDKLMFFPAISPVTVWSSNAPDSPVPFCSKVRVSVVSCL